MTKLVVFSSSDDVSKQIAEPFGKDWETFGEQHPCLTVGENGRSVGFQNNCDLLIAWEPNNGDYSYLAKNNIEKNLLGWCRNQIVYFVLHRNTPQAVHDTQRRLMKAISPDRAIEKQTYSHALGNPCYDAFSRVVRSAGTAEYSKALKYLSRFLCPAYKPAMEILAFFFLRYISQGFIIDTNVLEKYKKYKDMLDQVLDHSFPNESQEKNNSDAILDSIDDLEKEGDIQQFEVKYRELRNMMFEHIVKPLNLGI